MDIKETISEGVEQFKEHIHDTDNVATITQSPDTSGGFWSNGPSGWIYPAFFSMHMAATFVAASLGNSIADRFLTNHALQETAFLSAIFTPWISYKGFRSWHKTKERIAAKTPTIISATPIVTATATAADGNAPSSATITTETK